MLVRSKRRLAHLVQQLAKHTITINFRSQHESVHEESDQTFSLSPVTIRDRSSNEEIRLAAVTPHQQVECRQQRHEQRRVTLASNLFQTRKYVSAVFNSLC